MSRASQSPLTLRPVAPEDEPFLRALYVGTRTREMAATGWPEAFQTHFLQGQFDAQQRSYREQFPEASFDVVLAGGKPVGRLSVAWLSAEIRVVEITLLAACQGKGWGTSLLKRLLAEADRLGVPVRLSVATDNRARRLYQRLGFRETDRQGFYCQMERPKGGD